MWTLVEKIFSRKQFCCVTAVHLLLSAELHWFHLRKGSWSFTSIIILLEQDSIMVQQTWPDCSTPTRATYVASQEALITGAERSNLKLLCKVKQQLWVIVKKINRIYCLPLLFCSSKTEPMMLSGANIFWMPHASLPLPHSGGHSAAGIDLRKHGEPTAFVRRSFLMFLSLWYSGFDWKSVFKITKPELFSSPLSLSLFPLVYSSVFLSNWYKEEKRGWKINKQKYFLIEGREGASVSAKQNRNVASKQKICESGCWGKFCQTIFIGFFITIIIKPLCFQHYLSLLGKTDDFFRSPEADAKTSITETGSGHKSRSVSSSVTRAIPAVEVVIHFSHPRTNDHLFFVTSWSFTATEHKQQATLKQESKPLPEEVTSKYLCSDQLMFWPREISPNAWLFISSTNKVSGKDKPMLITSSALNC